MRKALALLGLWALLGLVMGDLMIRVSITLLGDQAGSGTEVTIGGYTGGFMKVTAGSPVCVSAILEDGPFEVTTPSGKFIPTEKVGTYYHGSGCFSPGIWYFTGSAPIMVLTNPDGLKAESITPDRVVDGTRRFGLFMAGFTTLFGFFFTYRSWR